MNLLRYLSLTALAAGSAVILAGCGSKAGETHAHGQEADHDHAAEAVATPQFSAKHGLSLPEQTRRSIGLKIVEVTEQRLESTLELPLRVYQSQGPTALASGTVAPEEAQRLKPGQEMEIELPGGKTVSGRVTRVADGLQRATGSLEVLVEVLKAPAPIPAGAFLTARAPTGTAESVIAIPRSALLECSEGQFVYTVSGEHLVRTAVQVGATNAELVEIRDGLYAGDQVAAHPVMSLWMTELAAVKGGQACCVVPPKGK